MANDRLQLVCPHCGTGITLAKRMGMEFYLASHPSPEEFVERINRFLERHFQCWYMTSPHDDDWDRNDPHKPCDISRNFLLLNESQWPREGDKWAIGPPDDESSTT